MEFFEKQFRRFWIKFKPHELRYTLAYTHKKTRLNFRLDFFGLRRRPFSYNTLRVIMSYNL